MSGAWRVRFETDELQTRRIAFTYKRWVRTSVALLHLSRLELQLQAEIQLFLQCIQVLPRNQTQAHGVRICCHIHLITGTALKECIFMVKDNTLSKTKQFHGNVSNIRKVYMIRTLKTKFFIFYIHVNSGISWYTFY